MIIALFAFTLTVLGGVAGMLARQTRAIDERFERFGAQVDARFGQVDARFDQVDARLDRMDDRFDRMDTRLDRMDSRFDRMDIRLDRMDEHLGQLGSELVEVKIAIARLEGPQRRLQQL
ncbi:response regulator [Microbacterium sp.]|uniref:response regulator n=1 Tax=Microbacterium sp. TaxID=51671 RepID=UPI0039E2F81F